MPEHHQELPEGVKALERRLERGHWGKESLKLLAWDLNNPEVLGRALGFMLSVWIHMMYQNDTAGKVFEGLLLALESRGTLSGCQRGRLLGVRVGFVMGIVLAHIVCKLKANEQAPFLKGLTKTVQEEAAKPRPKPLPRKGKKK